MRLTKFFILSIAMLLIVVMSSFAVMVNQKDKIEKSYSEVEELTPTVSSNKDDIWYAMSKNNLRFDGLYALNYEAIVNRHEGIKKTHTNLICYDSQGVGSLYGEEELLGYGSDEGLEYLDLPSFNMVFPLSFEGECLKLKAESSSDIDEISLQANIKSSDNSFYSRFTSYEFPIWIIVGAMAILLLAGVNVSRFKEWQDEPLSLDTSKCIRGFFAVAIILHHLTQDLAEKSGPLEFLSECGVLFVGVFFFFSGYGLYSSLKTKKDYLKGFLKKRLLTILVPFYMCILVFFVAACISGTKYKRLEIVAVLSGWSLINSQMWYIVEISILYLVFFIIYRLIKDRTVATILMSIFVLTMMNFSLHLAHGKDFSCSYWFMGEWWYNSSFLFVIGILVSKHVDFFRKIARKAYWIFIFVFGVLTWILGVNTHVALMTYSYWSEIPGEDPAIGDKLHCLSVQLPWIICFVMLLLLIMMKVRFGNPVLKFLGTISLELYLLHNLFIVGLRDDTIFKVPSDSMYMTLTILMSIGLATVVRGADKFIIALLTGRKKDDH